MNRNQNGMALVVVLGVIAVLLVTGLHLSKMTTETVTLARLHTDQFTAREMARSAIHLAMALLADDAAKTDTDAIQEDWADPDTLSRMVEQLGYSRGQIRLAITDELGKIQVNALMQRFPGHQVNPDQVMLWERLLEQHVDANRSQTDHDPQEVINALIDWLDSGDDDAVTGLSGAESLYYAGRFPAHACANKDIDHLSEMRNVKGFSADMFAFSGNEPDPEVPGKTAPVTWKDLFTVYGLFNEADDGKSYRYPGRININTANLEVIQALLPLGMTEFAQDMLDYRAQKSEDGEMFLNPLDKGWYRRVIGLSANEREKFERMIRYDSHIFRVTALVRLNRAQVGLTAYVLREQQEKSRQWICRIIQMERM
ncbi:MAG: type II secretion system protein GspK [Desulfotignum sp.]|nr:type II secretion system protein GspK [Desulfotignum sp.]